MSGATGSGWAGSGTTLDPYALVFDGVDDLVTLPAALDTFGASSFTWEAWLETTANMQFGTLISESTDGNPSQLGLALNYNSFMLYGYDSSGWGSGFSSWNGAVTINDGHPHHILASTVAQVTSIYCDGVPVSFDWSAHTMLTPNVLTIGAWRLNSGYILNYFPGSIPAARIYPFALTAAQVAQNYAAGPNASAGVWGDGVTPGAVLELVAAYGNAFVGG
jgi:hypothetical protein